MEMSLSSVDLGVVIVTFNHHDLLRPCLKSVQRAMEGIPGDIYLVDNASVDETRAMLHDEFPEVRVIYNDYNVHYTRAVNQGIRAAQEKYVFLLNDDTVLEPDCLRELLALAESRPLFGAAGPMATLAATGDVDPSVQRFPTPWREILRMTGISYALHKRGQGGNEQTLYPSPVPTGQVDWVGGGFILLPRQLMADLGHHDENYLFYRDDPDIGMRLKNAGREVWYCTEARLVHHHGMSTVKTGNKVRFEIIFLRSRRHYLIKHHGLLACLVVESTALLTSFLRMLKSLLLLRFDQARTHFRGIKTWFQALCMPKEEKEAIAGYQKAKYNGIHEMTILPPKAGETPPTLPGQG